MRTADLRAILRSRPSRPVPPDLRDKLVTAIPEAVGVGAPARPLNSSHRWAYAVAAAAAFLLVGALHFGGYLPWSGNAPAQAARASYSLVPAAYAEVAANLRKAGALVMELDQRTAGRENFDHVDPEADFVPVHIWLERSSERFSQGRMRIEKPDRRVVFNGQATLLYFSPVQEKQLSSPGEAQVHPGGRIDGQLADPARWLGDFRGNAEATVVVDTLEGKSGNPIVRVSIEEMGIEVQNPADVQLDTPFRPWFYDQFDRRTVVCWDAQTQVLTDVEKYVRQGGKEVMVAKLRSIEYSDRLDDSVFSHELPAGTHMQALADPTSQRYSDLSPVEVTRTFFNAWQEKDWDTVRLFCDSQLVLAYMRIMDLRSFRITGQPFKFNPTYAGFNVPYELTFANGEVKKHALAIRNDNAEKRWVWDGGL